MLTISGSKIFTFIFFFAAYDCNNNDDHYSKYCACDNYFYVAAKFIYKKNTTSHTKLIKLAVSKNLTVNKKGTRTEHNLSLTGGRNFLIQ